MTHEAWEATMSIRFTALLSTLILPISSSYADSPEQKKHKDIVLITARGTYIRRKPERHGGRFGVVRRGARVAVERRITAPGCQGQWLKLRVGGYLCSAESRPTTKPPGGPIHPVTPKGRRLPYRYIMVGRDGSTEYATWSDAASDLPLEYLEPGFGRTYRRVVRREGLRFYRTTRGTYIPAEDAFRIHGSRFRGLAVQETPARNRLPLVFTHRSRTTLYRSPSGGVLRRVKRFKSFRITGAVKGRRDRLYYRVHPAGFFRARHVRLALPRAAPYEVGAGKKWVDLDINQQVLVAYEGNRPVYATLMSSGRGKKTPTGVFRVWAKLAATDMDNDARAENRYSMWNVPWTLYFKGGLAIHGTYWHNRFGYKKSHGCINLSPKDARWVFNWSSPTLPPGWWARLPARGEDSLVVRIHKSSPRSVLAFFRPRRRLPSLGVWSWPGGLSLHR